MCSAHRSPCSDWANRAETCPPLGTRRTSHGYGWVTLQVGVYTCRSRFLFQKLLGRLSLLCTLLFLFRWIASTTLFTLFIITLASLTFRSSYLFLEWGLGQSPPPQIEIGTGIIPLLTSTNVAFAIYASREYQRACVSTLSVNPRPHMGGWMPPPR